jgi:translation initiation factor eIF-2B subunit alpha/methylthioribose-1-phosphate isomerase
MKVNGEELRSVEYFENNIIRLIDQRAIPEKLKFFDIMDYKDACYAIKEMVVRGAPAIGVTAAFAMSQAYLQKKDLNMVAESLRATRPTAYDLNYAVSMMLESSDPVKDAKEYCNAIVEKARKIGEYGAELIEDGCTVMTHCNAGALATVDYGTALAPIRMAKEKGKRIRVLVSETRPRLQGARLTAWELVNEGIEHYIIADGSSGYFMKRGMVNIIIVGADRVVANGDFANKIGTYEKAVLAKENCVPFYVAAPVSTFDFSLSSGDGTPIEERSEDEVLFIAGRRIAPEGSRALNPAFDVTPHNYVRGFITEYGIFKPEEIKKIREKSHQA